MTAAQQIQPNTIPTAYQQLGAVRGFHPRPFEQLRWVIKGKGGSGKSTFLSSVHRCLHADMEGGGHSVVNSDAVRVPIDRNHELWMRLFLQLMADGTAAKHDRSKLPFGSVAIDTIDGLCDMEGADLVAEKSKPDSPLEHIGEFGKDGAGYQLLYIRVLKALNALEGMGYGWMAALHLKEKDIRVREGNETVTRTVIRPAIGGSLARNLEDRADINATIELGTFTTTEYDERKLPDGRTIKNPRKVSAERCVIHVECRPEDDAKRRLYTFRGDLVVPLRGGWDTLRRFYDEKVVEMQAILTKEI